MQLNPPRPADCRHRVTVSLALVLFLATLSGCGFHLRGDRALGARVGTLYLETPGAAEVGQELRRQLAINSIRIVDERAAAKLAVTVAREQFATRVVSIDPESGKAREYELGFRAELSVAHPDGRRVIADEPIDLLRDYTFDETAVLGKSSEETLVRRQLIEDAADTILRRVEAVASE